MRGDEGERDQQCLMCKDRISQFENRKLRESISGKKFRRLDGVIG